MPTAMSDAERLQGALEAGSESEAVQFRRGFDGSARDWLVLVRDIVAIANSGGGAIVLGVDDSGQPSGAGLGDAAGMTLEDLSVRLERYTGQSLESVEIRPAEKTGRPVIVILIDALPVPLVFTETATAEQEGEPVFVAGSVYFRHGLINEPGNSGDLREAFKRELQAVKGTWLDGVRKLVEAPRGAVVEVNPDGAGEVRSEFLQRVRVVDDPQVPAYREIDLDVEFPYRQKELIEEVKRRLPNGMRFNSHDVKCLWRVHDVGSHDKFFHVPKFSTSPHYSEAFIDWILTRHREDPTFFDEMRRRYMEMRKKGL